MLKSAHVCIRLITICAIFFIYGGHNTTAAADTLAHYDIYLKECSKCHGVVTANGNSESVKRVAALAPDVTPGTHTIHTTSDHPQSAFALPYGPSLHGIIGRRAGSVDDYEYSDAFLTAMQETIWDANTIDDYITDSQERAPGSRMYYRQADVDIRRRIIEFLSTLN